MIKGLLSSSQAMAMQAQRHDLIANNLANVNTPGFQRLIARVRSEQGQAVPGGAPATGQRLEVTSVPSQRPGALRPTGNPLDVAIGGEGYFLVETPVGLRLSRDGSFGLSREGELIHSSGNPVLADGSSLIIRGTPSILPDGSVMDGERLIGRLTLVRPNSMAALRRDGENLHDALDGYEELEADEVRVVSGHLEGSNVDAVEEMVSMIRAFKAYEIAQKAAQSVDDTLQTATQKVGALRA